MQQTACTSTRSGLFKGAFYTYIPVEDKDVSVVVVIVVLVVAVVGFLVAVDVVVVVAFNSP